MRNKETTIIVVLPTKQQQLSSSVLRIMGPSFLISSQKIVAWAHADNFGYL
jgi:hypothetical protein